MVSFSKKNEEIITVIKLKKYITNNCIFCIIIYKFSYGQKLYLVILFLIKKHPKINFYYTVLLFSLAIHLKIESNKKLLLNAKKITFQKPEL